MPVSTTRSTSTPLANLRQALKDLATADDPAAMRRVLIAYPGLLQPGLDPFLTRRLQEAWGRGDKASACIFLACRAFLARCRSKGTETALAELHALPLPRHSPFGELLLLPDEQTDMGQRADLARRALADVRRTSEPDLWAALQRELANCLAQSEGSGRCERLKEAMLCYQSALEILDNPPYAGSLRWAQTLHNMANALRRQVDGQRIDNLKLAVQLYQKALTVRTKEDHPVEWAATQRALGNAWLETPARDSVETVENVRKGIECYEAALTVCTRQAMPDLWAETTHNMALAYSEHPGDNRVQNLERAIKLCQDVLDVRSPDKHPLEWGRSQVALANAYVMRLQGDRADNLKQAIAHYEGALNVLAREDYPADWARTHYNLAIAYRHRPIGDRADNLGSAIKYYRCTLEIYTPETYPLEWAHVQTGLGNVYCQSELGQRAANLEYAIDCYRAALTVRTRDNDPHGWATVKNNLGNAYADRILENRAAKTDSQEKAIACYREALQVRTRRATPARWAETMNNLGTIYSERLLGDPVENQRKAISYLSQALEVHSPRTFPNDSRRAARNLANLHFQQRDWDAALDVYHVAMDAGERLYRAGLSAESKAVEVAENVALYRHAAFATARLRQASEALLTFERGKTRLLAEALRLHVSRPTSVPDKAWTAFEQAGAMVRTVQSGDSVLPGEEHDPVRAYTAREQAALEADTALDAAIKRIRRYAPGFLKDLDLSTVLDLLPDKRTALVAFCITDQGSVGFVVSQNQSEAVQIVDVPCFCQADLRRLLFAELDEQGQMTGGWVGDYVGPNRTRWRFTMKRVLAEIGKKLFAPIAAALPKDVKDLMLLPSGGLFILPLHAMPLSSNGSDLVCDRYQVSYAPSIEVLADCQAKAARSGGQSLYAAINPEEDPLLAFTPVEGAAIAALFDQRKIDEGGAGTKDAVKDGVRGKAYLHFSCHAVYNWHDPPQSGLILADGRLTLAELQNGVVDMSAARLVTLSACETGLTDILKGSAEEYVGLPAGFMLAGVPCVVSSLWSVPDLSTALLMERFYVNHVHGDPNEDPKTRSPLSPVEALRRAQIWLRDEVTVQEAAERCNERKEELERKGEDPPQWLSLEWRKYTRMASKMPDSHPFAHPYYWAAFALYGAGGNPE
jgi:CHAT domain-containing protein/tetratricopeptide (TPR) repeat protein